MCVGGGVVSRELKVGGSRGLRHSINLIDMHMHDDFYINQLAQLSARLILTQKQPKFKRTQNILKRCSALTVRDRKKCYRDKVVEQEILHLHDDFYINHLVQLGARLILTRKQPKFKRTQNILKRCSALTVRDRKKCYRDKVVEQEILHLHCGPRFALRLIV